MAERVHPSAAKPTTAMATTATNGAAPSFPPNKAQLYNASRPTYRPREPPPRRSRGRSCCCSCCLWTTLTLILILLLVALAGAVFWVLYRPRFPSFSVTSLRVSRFNLTSSSHLTSNFNLTVSARNPNSKITYIYDRITVSLTSGGVVIGDGTLPAFVHWTKNTTTVRSLISNKGAEPLDEASASTLRSNMKNRNGLPLAIQLDTKVQVKIGSVKTKKVTVRVTCDDVRAALPTRKSPASATSDANCKVDVRIKIWRWTI